MVRSKNKNENFPKNIPEDIVLAEGVVDGDPALGREFYDKNHRLAEYFASIAMKNAVTGVMDTKDLKQEALFHMVKSAGTYDPLKAEREESYDPDKPAIPASFSTWASKFMVRNLQQKLGDQYAVRLPENARQLVKNIQIENNIRLHNQQPPLTDEEMSEQFNIPFGPADDTRINVSTIRQAIALIDQDSLDDQSDPAIEYDPTDDDSDSDKLNVQSSVYSDEPLSVEDMVANKEMRAAVERMLSQLNEFEEKVIRLRFGIDDNQPRTLDEIGQMLGYTRERIRQVESKSVAKLRRPGRHEEVKGYV